MSRDFPPHLSDEEYAALWADLTSRGALCEEDERALQRWLEEMPGRAALYSAHRRLLLEPAMAMPRATSSMRMVSPRDVRSPSRRYVWTGALAAAFTLIAVLVGPRFVDDVAPGVSEREFVTPPGITQRVHLPDGSEVQLNGATRLHVRMSGNARELELRQGEAFFTVAHDTARPFSVRVAQGRVVAVGTAFNVNALSQATEVSVTEGVVRLEVNGPVPPSRLAAGERASIAEGGAIARLLNLASGNAADWRSGWLEVEDARLADVIEAVNRATSRPVRLTDPSLEDLRVTGRYNLRRSGEAFAAIARTLNLTLVQDGSEQRLVRGGPMQRK